MLSDVPRIRARPLFESRHLRQQRRRALSCKSAATAAAGNMSFDVPRPPSRPSSRAGGQSALLARATTPAPGQVIHPFTSAAHFLPLNSRALHRLIILSQCSSCTDTVADARLSHQSIGPRGGHGINDCLGHHARGHPRRTQTAQDPRPDAKRHNRHAPEPRQHGLAVRRDEQHQVSQLSASCVRPEIVPLHAPRLRGQLMAVGWTLQQLAAPAHGIFGQPTLRSAV